MPYHGGKTAHSRFGIPINVNEESICNIYHGTPLAELIVKVELIIWDEAPMTHKHCFEAVDKTFRGILRFTNLNSANKLFGGKFLVFGGDFRQTLHVISKGLRQDIVHASLNSSYLWRYCEVLTLNRNMRLQTEDLGCDVVDLKKFSDWVLSIGDRTTGDPNDGEADIEILDEFMVQPSSDPILSIVDISYLSPLKSITDYSYLQHRAILASTHEIVDKINDYILSLIPEKMKTYLSFNNTCNSNDSIDGLDDVHTHEFLNTITSFGLPNHELKLKVGVPIMLLRNIDQSSGLCNGTRLLVNKLGNHIIEEDVISGANQGHNIFIPRLSLTPSNKRIPFPV